MESQRIFPSVSPSLDRERGPGGEVADANLLRLPLAMVMVWVWVSGTTWGRVHGIAAPSAVWLALLEELGDGTLLRDVTSTLGRTLGGTLAAVLAGGALGCWLGARPSRWREVEPWVDLLRSVPPALVYPVLLLGLGYGEGSRLAAVAFGAFGVVVLPVASALARAPRERAEVVRMAGLQGWEAFRVLHLPEALPSLVTATRLALAQGLVVSVVTELLVGARHGLGVRALAALQEFRPERLWLVALVAGALGVACNAAVGALGRRLVPWEAEEPARTCT